MLLIEIIKGKETHDSVTDAVCQLSLSIDKGSVTVNKDVLGFAASRIQFVVLREAPYLVEQGAISKEGIDNVMKYSLDFRYAYLGPLEVADFEGLDIFYHISDYLIKDLCDSHEIPSGLKEHCMKHEYGVECQQGLCDYHSGKDVEAIKQRDESLIKISHALYR